MKVKELFEKVPKEYILRAYRIMFEMNSSSDKIKYSIPELIAYDKLFDERAIRFIDAIIHIGEPEKEEKDKVIFVVQLTSDDYEEKDQKYFTSGLVFEDEFCAKAAKDFTVWGREGENNLTWYAYEMDGLESIANCYIADQSIEECSAVVCAAEILNEMTFYGFDREYRQENIDKLKSDLDKAMEEVDGGKFIPADDFLKEMHRDRLASLKDNDEKRYYELKREFRKAVMDIELRWHRKIGDINHQKLINHIKAEWNRRYGTKPKVI